MSTRAKIGILLEDQTVKSINIWQDGYPDYVGQILAKHYNKTSEQVLDLMAEGDILELESTSEGCRYAKDTAPTTYQNLTRFLNDHCGMDYIYIFSEKSGWQYINLNE